MINILIPEEIPSLNKGEAAILSGMLESFKLLGEEVNVSIFSVYYEEDKQRYGPEINVLDANGIMPTDIISLSNSTAKKLSEIVVSFMKHFLFVILYKIIGIRANNIMKREAWQAYVDSDVIIICHDSLFCPIYHTIVTLFCKFIGKRLVIYGATFNLTINKDNFCFFKKMLAKYLMKIVFKNVNLITLREELSYQLLREIRVNSTPMYITGDFPFLLRAAEDERVREVMETESLENCGIMIGMTVGRHKMGIVFPEIGDPETKCRQFTDTMTEVVNHLTNVFNATVVFIPHCIGADDRLDDRIIANEILEKAHRKDRVRVINREYTPEELKGLSGKFQIFIGMRLHSIVDAVSMGIPSIMLSHANDNRAYGIIGKMLAQEKWIYDLKYLTAPSLINRINDLWKSRNEVKNDLIPKVEFVRRQTMLNGQLLAKLIKGTIYP